MLFARIRRVLSSRNALAVAAGVCLACAFPDLGVAGLAWIAPGLLVLAAVGTRGGEAFRIGFLGAVTHYLISLSWLLNIPYRWLGIPLAPAAGWLALSAFVALGPATWVWMLATLVSRVDRESAAAPPPHLIWQIARQLPSTWSGRALWALVGAAGWVAFEMYITRIFGGFPWNLLGNSQYRLVPLLQVAQVTGVYGISFVMVWFALALVGTIPGILRGSGRPSLWTSDLILPVLAIALLYSAGLRETRNLPFSPRTLRVTMVQPSIPQTLIWDPASDDTRFKQLIEVSKRALKDQPQLLVWPEAAIPKLLRYNSETFDAVAGLAREHRVWMIVGADDAEPIRETPDPDDAEYYNSSFLINPDGELAARYKKRSLVIFGEYIPLAKWLPFLSWFTPIQGGFTAGDAPVPFPFADLDVEASVLICYEDVFPAIARSAAAGDTDFLVNITNNGWFGEGAAQWQHAISGVFRAIENRRPLIRCTNTGLTCWIDPHGRIRDYFRDAEGTIYGEGFLTFELPLPDKESRPGPTFYNRHGDVFGWFCVGIFTIPFALVLARRYRRAGNTQQPQT